jgi:hypothetical protein
VSLTERLALLVTLDPNAAVKGLESIGKAADRNLGKTTNHLDQLGSKFTKAGTGMLAGAGLAATGLYKAGRAAADLEQAVGGTEAVFKDTSGVIDRFAKDSATKMGLSERAFREATTSIGGQLKGLGFSLEDSADKAIDLTGVAADLAATYGGTTAEAVQALGAAFRGEADPAERFNLFLNQNRVNAEAVALGLAKSTSSVDANAKAQATLSLITKQSADAQGQFGRETGTAAGQMQIASAEFENAKAALGESVAPILASVAGGLADVAGGFTRANEVSGGFLSKLATVGTIGLGAAGGLSFVVGKVISMRENLGRLVGPLKNVDGGLKGLGARSVTAAGQIGILYAAVQLLGDSAPHADLSALENDLLDLAESGKVGGEVAKTFGGDLDRLGQAVERIAAPSGLSKAQNAAEGLRRALGDTDDSLSTARARIDDLDEALSSLASRDPEAAAAALRAIQDGMSPESGRRLVGLLDDYNNTLKSSDTASRTAADAAGEFADATGLAADGQRDASGATEDLTDRLKAQTEAYDNLLDAVLSQFDADIAYRRSLDSTEDALTDVNTALKEHGPKSEEYQRSLLSAEDALLGQADAAVRLYEDTVKASGGTVTAAEKSAIYKGALEELAGTLDEGSPLRARLLGYAGQLDAVKGTYTATVLADTDGAFQTVKEFIAYLNTIGVKGPSGFTLLLDFKQQQLLEGRASGGPVRAGTPYVIGEDGPEVFVPNRSGSIIPNNRLSSSGSQITSGGGSQTIVVQIGDEVVARLVANGQTNGARRGVSV